MALILPKGIVVNTPEIEGSIGRIQDEPLDPADIAKFWKVYTTTRRRLLDPTAERLENYWWRIWGSQRRELNGVTVARLFAHISDGQSFVPLRGPANRDEGNSPSIKASRNGLGASSAINFQESSSSRPSTTSSSATSKAPTVMPHPILKKTRGPSNSGPRPTARFISPHESENETNSPVSPNSHVVVQPPSPDSQESKTDKKTSSASSKKQGFVASSASKKKRPVIVRRKSSQSSTDVLTKAAEGQVTGQPSSSGKPSPTIPEPAQARAKVTSQFQENLSPSPEKSPKKRSTSKSGDSKVSSSKAPSSSQRGRGGQGNGKVSNGDPGPSTLRSVENRDSSQDLNEEDLEELEMQRILLAEANARLQEKPKSTTPVLQGSSRFTRDLHTSNRSASESTLSVGASRSSSNDNKSIASLAPTLTSATGELGLRDDNLDNDSKLIQQRINKGKGKSPEDMFAKIPVQPSTGTSSAAATTPSSLARSKSQLTLLLEKDRVRGDEKRSKEDRKNGRKG